MEENQHEISINAVSLISAREAFEKNILPLKIHDNFLHIGLPNKNDLKLVNDLTFYTGYKIKVTEMPADVILKKLKEIYPESELKKESKFQQKDYSFNEYSTVEFVNEIIRNAIKIGASDIHFEAYENYFRIRYRIDGHLKEMFNLPLNKSLAISSRLKIMANLDISEKRRPQDGRIRFSNNNDIIDIRLSTLPTNFAEKIVLRILDKSQLKLDLKKMGLENKQYKVLLKNINQPYGMILVTGPTGSGKSTTLYAVLQNIYSEEKNIMTVEDPIEYNFPGINQTNVKPDIGFDFANALRAFLRQDPDVIMVGEIRDRETAEIAIRASLTGHLVFSTLHTNDSVSAITRLTDMGIEPFLVASSLKLLVAQRLVRTLCTCKKKNTHNFNDTQLRENFIKTGCVKCNHTGYKGRTALYELLAIDEKISLLISQNSNVSEIKKAAIETGFKSLRDSGIMKINSGITTYEEVLRETML